MSAKVTSAAWPKGDLFHALEARQYITPDYPALRLMESVPLFVYDSFKGGEVNANRYLDGNARFCGRGLTVSSRYIMKVGVDYPAIFKQQDTSRETAHVKGDIWLVSPEMIRFMDNMIGNETFFVRKWTKVYALDQDFVQGMQKVGGNSVMSTMIYEAIPEMFEGIRLQDKAISTKRVQEGEKNGIMHKPMYQWNAWDTVHTWSPPKINQAPWTTPEAMPTWSAKDWLLDMDLYD